MPTMIYAPEVTIRIRTSKDSRGKGQIIDVSEDAVSGSVTRILNGLSTFDCTLLNQGRKYDEMFSPMDTFSVRFRRLRRVLKITGYLDSVPLWQALPGSINLTGSCTLKRLQQWLWDPTSDAALALIRQSQRGSNHPAQMDDGGTAYSTVQVLTQAAGWPQAQIHIARVPHEWSSQVSALANRLIADSEAARINQDAGSSPILSGTSTMLGTTSTIPSDIPGTGTIPATSGKISEFGGPNGGAYGHFALTGESGVSPADPWYCAMRWPYVNPNLTPAAGVNVSDAMGWWKNRHIQVSSPKTGKAVVLRAADWGPNISTGRVIDVSPAALKALGAVTDDVVNIGFAASGSSLGLVVGQAGPLTGQSVPLVQGAGAPPITSGWGAPGDHGNMTTVTAAGCRFTVNKMAVNNFVGFVNDLVSIYGYHPQSIGGYNYRPIAGTSSMSNHAWGAAIDIDPSKNPRYGSRAGGTYALPKPPGIVNLARKWGLGWGGEYQNSKDYMHFEVIGAPASNAAAYKTNPQGTGAVPSGSATITKWQPPLRKYTLGPRFGETGPHWAHGHSGTDFQAPTGTPIYPVGPGTVFAKGTGDADYGNHITIDHGNKVYTFYAHMLNDSPLAVGTAVTTDTQIGQVDTTGNATGPHVHVELRKGADTYDAALASGGIDKYVLGPVSQRAAPPAGVTLANAGGYVDTGLGTNAQMTPEQTGQGLFSAFRYNLYESSQAGQIIGGYRALINDVPIFSTVEQLMQIGLRHFSSAPNGDFIGWFPDYFGHYNMAGKMIVTPLEINGENGPPTIGWSDTNLKTHEFVSSASSENAGDAATFTRMATTAGVASVEFPELMKALLNISDAEAKDLGTNFLTRFGARMEYAPMDQISGARQEFYFACHRFMMQWSAQFQAQVSLSFMPELYPGMLLCLPDYGIQGYLNMTVDSWDLNGGGFSTQVSAAPWSSIGDSRKTPAQRLPRGAPL